MTTRTLKTWVALACAFALPLVAHGSAHAASGVITGGWQFWNRNGNFCPTANACAGSRYPQSIFNTAQPVSNAVVWITDGSFNKIGQGVTDDNGNFSVGWNTGSAPAPAQIRSLIFPTHRDNRFWFANTAGQLINNTTAAINRGASPQAIGTWVVGSQASPDSFYNSYWAAELQLRNVLNLVGIQQANFTNVEIRGFADNMPGYLPGQPHTTSAADGSQKRVQLDTNAGFSPQARAMHELGHIANYVANPYSGTGLYNWVQGATAPQAPNQGGSWGQGTAEWGSVAFEEALATHYGSITFWWDNSDTPTTCFAGQGATCYAGGTPVAGNNIEATSYPFSTNNCSMAAASPEARWPVSAMRYFWDVFDNHNDADGDSYSANQGQFWMHLGVLAAYGQGTGANQNNEPWNAAMNSITEPDGRGCVSYMNNFQTLSGTGTSLLRTDNCNPP